MRFLRTATALVLIGVSGAAMAATASKSQPTLRDQEQAACYDDAQRLCKDAIPDEDKITACMKAKFSQVSAGCKKFFK
jgi:hypothetical protein